MRACAFGAGKAEQAAEEVDVLDHGERRVEVPSQPLRHVGDAGRCPVAVRGRGHVAAEHPDRSRPAPLDAGYQRQERRFADAVRADHGRRRSAGDGERNIVEGGGVSVAVGDAVE